MGYSTGHEQLRGLQRTSKLQQILKVFKQQGYEGLREKYYLLHGGSLKKENASKYNYYDLLKS